MNDKVCVFCGRQGHRSSQCPYNRARKVGAKKVPVGDAIERNDDAAWDEWDRLTGPGDLDPLDSVHVRGEVKT